MVLWLNEKLEVLMIPSWASWSWPSESELPQRMDPVQISRSDPMLLTACPSVFGDVLPEMVQLKKERYPPLSSAAAPKLARHPVMMQPWSCVLSVR